MCEVICLVFKMVYLIWYAYPQFSGYAEYIRFCHKSILSHKNIKHTVDYITSHILPFTLIETENPSLNRRNSAFSHRPMSFNIHHIGLKTCQHYLSEVSAIGMLNTMNTNLKTAEKASMLIQLVHLYKCVR